MAQYTSEHGHQIFVHAEAKGGAGREVPSVAYVNRASPILNEDKAYRVAIERFYLHGVTLPLFSCDKVWKIGMRIAGGSTVVETVNFGTDEYLYDLRWLATHITTTMASLASTVGCDAPSMSYDPASAKFTLTTTGAFRAGYELLFSERMKWALNSFWFHPTMDEDRMYQLVLSEDDEVQGTSTIELLSPVSRAALRTTSLPVVPELIPPLAGEDPGEINRRETGFLVDYNISQSSSQSTQGILFTPPGFLRWHNLMTTSDLSAFSISAWWIDYKGNFHQIYLPVEDATLEIYMIFKDTLF